jgi:CheY-like chemotaxis protein
MAMPDVDGPALADAANGALAPYAHVLLMTGYAPSRLGRVKWPHITKPFTPSELLTRLRTLLETPDARNRSPL